MKVVTPIRPTGWRLTYNGDWVSLSPSIATGVSLAARIIGFGRTKAIPAGMMATDEIEAGRERDAASSGNTSRRRAPPPRPEAAPAPRVGFWRRFVRTKMSWVAVAYRLRRSAKWCELFRAVLNGFTAQNWHKETPHLLK